MRYVPGVKANNDIKELFIKEAKAVLYRLEKGKINSNMDKDGVFAILSNVKEEMVSLENSFGTGSENVWSYYEEGLNKLRELKKQSEQNYLNRFEAAADDLCFTINIWKSVLEGVIDYVDHEEMQKQEKLSWSKKKLNARLEELGQLKSDFLSHERRLEKDILQIEKDVAELDELLLEEDNERKLNELFRKISTLKSKLDMLNVRRGNFSACYNILDMIEANVSEIVVSGEYAGDEIGKAKAFLNIAKLKTVITEPEKAISILKQMQTDTKAISERLKSIDARLFQIGGAETVITDDAMKYKEELLRKKREKQKLETAKEELDTSLKESVSVKKGI